MNKQSRIVRGRWIIQDPDRVLNNGAIVIEDGKIIEIGRWETIERSYPDSPILGSDQHAILPGLINAHHHSNGVTAVQHGIPDRLLELWLLTLAQRRRVGPYLTTLLSAARLLSTGVTSVVDVYSGHGKRENIEAGVKQALQAYDQAGLRVAYAIGITEKGFLAWGEDETFLGSLPGNARTMAERRLPASDSITADEYLDLISQLHHKYRSHPRLGVWFGPPGPQWTSDNLLVRIADKAAELGTGIQTHLLESVYEKHHGPRSYGKATLLHLQDLGILSPRLSFAHGVWLTEKEIEILVDSGAHVAHNPSSNLRLRAGIAPLNSLLKAGVNVGLGMDGTTLNDDEDMFTEMRLALNLHRTPRLDGPAPAVDDIWRLATENGARLMGTETSIGRLAPGYAADIVLLNLDRLSWPWLAPEANPLSLLLSRLQAKDVDIVLIDGEVVFKDGQPTGFDVIAAGEELADILASTVISREAKKMVETLLPHVNQHYLSWPFQKLDPYDVFNSRR